jgi:SAM-dependent methyltransferase
VTTYFEYYGDLGLQRFMVSDRRRTDAFAHAIQEVVSAGDLVLDVGTGTGILAMLAARCGAQHVHAIDQANVVQVARNLVKHNGLEDRVTVLEGNAKDLDLGHRVDVIVSEWLGQMAFEENMLGDVLRARDVNLKPGGKMLPSGVEVLFAPISDAELYEQGGPGFWRTPIHGLDFAPLEPAELRQARAQRTRMLPGSLLAPGQGAVALDLATATRESPWQCGTLTFPIERDATCHGFAGWFVAQLSPSVALDTGPCFPETHWSQTYFPFPPVEVRAGERLSVDFELAPLAYSPRGIEIKLAMRDRCLWFALD